MKISEYEKDEWICFCSAFDVPDAKKLCEVFETSKVDYRGEEGNRTVGYDFSVNVLQAEEARNAIKSEPDYRDGKLWIFLFGESENTDEFHEWRRSRCDQDRDPQYEYPFG